MFEILLVDDSKADVKIMQEALERTHGFSRLHHAPDGVEAMAFLRRQGAYKDAPRPDLILLDINMPRKGGLQVLSEIKAAPDLRSIPALILSSSKEVKDVARAYDLHANGYVEKPVDFDDFTATMGAIEQFWSGIVKPSVQMVA